MSSSMNAAIHLGPNYVSNVEIHKNTKFEEIESLFNITQKGIEEHSEEILNVRSLDLLITIWTRSTLVIDEAIKLAKAKASTQIPFCVLVGWNKNQEQQKDGKAKLKISKCSSYQDAVEIDGEAIEFEEKNIPGFSSLSILQEIQKDLAGKSSRIGSSLCQCSMTLIGKKNEENCISNAEKIKNYAMNFSQGPWTFLGMEVLLTLKKENVIPQPTKWYSDSKKLVILCSKVSVPWVMES